MSWLLVWRFLRPALPYLAIAAAVFAVYHYVTGLQAKVAAQATSISNLTGQVKAEAEARQRDVGALTTLASGLTKVGTDTKADQRILQETINAAPTPSSPQLADFLARLRTQDAARGGFPGAPGGAGAKPVAASGSARRSD